MMQMIRFLTLLLLPLAISSNNLVAQDCNLSIATGGTGLLFFVDDMYEEVINQSDKSQSTSKKVDVQVKNSGTGRCQFFLTIDPKAAGTQQLSFKKDGRNDPKTNILFSVKDAAGKKILGGVEGTNRTRASTSADVISGVVGPNETVTIPLMIMFDELDFRPAGGYRTAFECALYEGEFEPQRTKSIVTKNFGGFLNINDVMRISLTALNQPAVVGGPAMPDFTVDFGELENNKQGQMTLHINTNNGYSINFTSENNGMLVNKEKTDQKIAYSMSVNGTPISFAVPGAAGESTFKEHLSVEKETIIQYGDPASAHTITFVIGDVKGKLAGGYEDVITVTVRSRR
ncbi:MAG: hypothetical protein J0G29_02330 [Alphaproteobacteria bacterium]|nr:hypothetical protein [Alphaproteobacteria bacterium]OJV45691.1 MAG: hypothetical protein BGO28_02420 [Alphaproteobacteria bacterium 43-37]